VKQFVGLECAREDTVTGNKNESSSSGNIEFHRSTCIHAKVGYLLTPGNMVQPNSHGCNTKFEIITQAKAMKFVTIKSE
jgi:hypothetical protein